MQTPDHTWGLFFATMISGIISLLPIKARSCKSWLLYAFMPTLMFYLLYELTMPKGMNIRADLVLIWPFLIIVAATTIVRWSKLNQP